MLNKRCICCVKSIAFAQFSNKNKINFYFIMKKTAISFMLALCVAAGFAQQPEKPKETKLFNVPINALTVYPNGVTSTLLLDMNRDGAQRINVYDAGGKHMMSAVPGCQLYVMDISKLPAGTYFVFIDYRNGKKDAKRFIKS